MMRVLIVEDDPLTAIDIAAVLADDGHQVVAVAESFADAMAAATSRGIDVALVDIGLKDGVTGVQVVRALRAGHAIPSILVSAERELHAKARAAGAAAYIAKPARRNDILRLVREMAAPGTAFC